MPRTSPLPSWAIVTPSYDLDFSRCKILCRSIDRFVKGYWHHYIVVDPSDLKMFRALASSKRTIVSKPDILPIGTYRYLSTGLPSPRLRRLWWSWSGPVAGWQVQQIIKICIASKLSELAVLHCDSDMFFVKDFLLSKLIKNEKIRLFRSKERSPAQIFPYPEMYFTAEDFLGITSIDRCYHNYGGNLITWKRDTAVTMMRHISEVHAVPWEKTLRKPAMISEYTIYGLFADQIGNHSEEFFIDNTDLCKTLFDPKNVPNFDIQKYCEQVETEQVAIGIQSNLGLGTTLLEPIAEKIFNKV